MSNKKNIDQLFKERFENHEVQPPAQVWENIQAAMREEKKDRMVIPLWWKAAGIAALLAIMFTIGNTVFNTSENNKLVEDTIENEKVEKEVSPHINTDKKFNTNNNASEVAEEMNSDSQIDAISEKNTTNENSGNDTFNNNVVENNTSKSTNQHVADSESKLKNAIKKQTNNNIVNKNTEVATTVNAKNTVKITAATNQKGEFFNPNEQLENTNATAVTQPTEKQSSQKDFINKNNQVETIKPNNTEAIANDTDLNKNNLETPESEKQSIFDAIKEQEDVAVNEVKDKINTPTDRWEVAPNFAPVYYNTISEGSSIDGSFADNSQSGDVNISYGVAVSYAVSDRLSVRSGVNNVNLGYSTGGLELGEGDISSALQSINYDGRGQVTIPQDEGTFAMQSDGDFGEISPKSTNGEAFVNQNINYYEIPLELKYALFNTKLGVNVIGGLSTLFLGNNEITVNAGDFSETLGEANNLSDVSFTTNVGLGFDYKFSEKFKFNVEPMFKYQLNPYTDSSVNFQPYYVGVYTGFSFKF